MYRTLCLVSSLIALTGCAGSEEVSAPEMTTLSIHDIKSPTGELPPIRQLLACLPAEAAITVAHRGTGDDLGAPENSLSGLDALIERGVAMAEIDVASIKDGTLISYHDGVWDEKSSGRGPVVATTAADFSRIRLREPGGTISGEAVPRLSEMLDRANDEIYLEVDFKSSADMATVIDELRARDMMDQVVLIAITDDEADILAPIAEGFVLSLPRSSARADQGVWVGGSWRDGTPTGLPPNSIIIGSQWNADGPSGARPLDILVTDAITQLDPIEGLTDHEAFQSCLSN